jgi:hypothetical protein
MNGRVIAAMLASVFLGGVGVPSAGMIAIYTLPGMPLVPEEAQALVQALREGRDPPAGAAYTHRVAGTSVLSADFSVPPGVSAYFWSDQAYRHDGFMMQGDYARFEAELATVEPALPALGKKALGTDADPAGKAWATELQALSADGGKLSLDYSVSRSGRISVEARGLDGRRLGDWKWDAEAGGAYRKILDMERIPPGIFLVRWSYGNVEVTRKVGSVHGRQR